VEGLVVAILIIFILAALVSYLPIDAELKRWMIVALLVILIVYLLRWGVPGI